MWNVIDCNCSRFVTEGGQKAKEMASNLLHCLSLFQKAYICYCLGLFEEHFEHTYALLILTLTDTCTHTYHLPLVSNAHMVSLQCYLTEAESLQDHSAEQRAVWKDCLWTLCGTFLLSKKEVLDVHHSKLNFGWGFSSLVCFCAYQ